MSEDSFEERMEKRRKAASEFDTNTFEEYAEKSKSEDPEVRRLAASRLTNLEDPRAVPILIKLMNDESARVRGTAALGLWHYEAEQARDLLIDHLRNDASFNVRALSAIALGSIGDADKELIKALDDPDWHVRVSAFNAIDWGDEQNEVKELERLLDDPDWRVRHYVCLELMDIGISNDKVIKTLEGLREVPKALEYLAGSEDAAVLMEINEQYEDEIDELIMKDASQAEIADTIREKYGEEAIRRPSPDPLGDLIYRAKELCKESEG